MFNKIRPEVILLGLSAVCFYIAAVMAYKGKDITALQIKNEQLRIQAESLKARAERLKDSIVVIDSTIIKVRTKTDTTKIFIRLPGKTDTLFKEIELREHPGYIATVNAYEKRITFSDSVITTLEDRVFTDSLRIENYKEQLEKAKPSKVREVILQGTAGLVGAAAGQAVAGPTGLVVGAVLPAVISLFR